MLSCARDPVFVVGLLCGRRALLLGMAYAARFPEWISHLVLVDSAPPRWSEIQSLYQQIFPELETKRKELSTAAKHGDRAASAAALRAYLSMLFYSPERRQNFLNNFLESAVNSTVMDTVLKDIARTDLTSDVKNFRFPTLVANGRFDTDIPPAVAFRCTK